MKASEPAITITFRDDPAFHYSERDLRFIDLVARQFETMETGAIVAIHSKATAQLAARGVLTVTFH